MKELVISMLDAKIALAVNNLCIAKMDFVGEKRGMSAKARNELLKEYENEVENLNKAREWILSV